MLNTITHFRYHKAWGQLIIRLAAGMVFLSHGWMKVNNLAGAESFFGTLGLPPGAATFVALIEVVGGIMLIAGIAPRLAGLVLGIEMLVALALVSVPNGTYELEMLLAASALGIFLMGGGRLALYSMERD